MRKFLFIVLILSLAIVSTASAEAGVRFHVARARMSSDDGGRAADIYFCVTTSQWGSYNFKVKGTYRTRESSTTFGPDNLCGNKLLWHHVQISPSFRGDRVTITVWGHGEKGSVEVPVR